MIRAERHLERVAPELQDLRAHVENLTEQGERARSLLGQRFPQAAEIERLTNEVADLEVEMAALEHDGAESDDGPEPDAPSIAPELDPTPPGPGEGAGRVPGTDFDTVFDVALREPDVGGGIEL